MAVPGVLLSKVRVLLTVSDLVLRKNGETIKKLIKKKYRIKFGKRRPNCLADQEEVRV